MENYNSYTIRYSEIALKGNNRIHFENQLVKNIQIHLKNNNVEFEKVSRPKGRILIETEGDINLKPVFGISSYSRCLRVKADMEIIKENTQYFIDKLNNSKDAKTFRVTCQRINKSFPKTSMEIEREIGGHIKAHIDQSVKLKGFDYKVHIEIINEYAYITDEKIQCLGGLPVGIEGTIFALIENDDSILASILFMKRGCYVIPVMYEDKDISLIEKFSSVQLFPKIIKDLSELNKYDEYSPKGLSTGYTIDNFKELKSDYVQLDPIILWTNDEIKNKLIELKNI